MWFSSFLLDGNLSSSSQPRQAYPVSQHRPNAGETSTHSNPTNPSHSGASVSASVSASINESNPKSENEDESKSESKSVNVSVSAIDC